MILVSTQSILYTTPTGTDFGSRTYGFDFKTTYHNLPPEGTVCSQCVRRIDAQIAVRFCAICSIYIMPKLKPRQSKAKAKAKAKARRYFDWA